MKKLGISLLCCVLVLSGCFLFTGCKSELDKYKEIPDLILELQNIISEYKIDLLVLGLPKNMNNTLGPRAIETLEFKDMLEKLNYKVVLQDERLSTVSAHNYMIKADLSRKKRKEKVDSLAATIILQTYLDKENNNERRTNEI